MEWTQIVMEAMSEFECKNPGALEELQSITEDNAWDHEKFRDAAAVIVEPDAYLCREEDMELFYEKSENEGSGFIKGVVQNQLWNHVIDTVDKTGY
jgi:hypothetical protein